MFKAYEAPAVIHHQDIHFETAPSWNADQKAARLTKRLNEQDARSNQQAEKPSA